VLKIHELELGLLAELLVEGRKGFVEQEHLRPLGECTSERDALALPARELLGVASGELLQLDEPQHFVDPGGDLPAGQPILPQAEGDVPLDAHVREQRIGLEHHVDRTAVGRHAGEVLVRKDDAPVRRLLEPREDAHERRLSAAGRAEKTEEFAVEDIKGKRVHGGDLAKALRHALEADERSRSRVGPRREGAPDRPDRAAGTS
jgi:hypothetical protein